MPKLKVLSGQEVIKIFESFGFSVVGSKCGHVKLKRIASNGNNQILTVPNHKELDKGTLKAIYNQALRYVSDQELKSCFYLK